MTRGEYDVAPRLHSASATVIRTDQDLDRAKSLVVDGVQFLAVFPGSRQRAQDDSLIEGFLEEVQGLGATVAHLSGGRLAEATRVWKGRSARLRGSRNFIVTPRTLAAPSARVFRLPDEAGVSTLVIGEFMTIGDHEGTGDPEGDSPRDSYPAVTPMS